MDTPPCPLCGTANPAPFAMVRGRRYFRCGVCALTLLDPAQRPTPEAERAEYGLHQNDPGDAGYRRFLSQATEPLRARLPPGAEGLDFGCGPGPAIAAMLAGHGFTVRNYDPLFHPDAAALERRYDFVTCTEVVEHFHQPAEGFARLDRLLRPGGWLAVMTGVLYDDTGFSDWPYIREASHVAFCRPETLTWIARHFGWDLTMAGRNVALYRKLSDSPA